MKKVPIILLIVMGILTSCNVFKVNRTSYVQGYTEYASALSLEKTATGSIGASARRAGKWATIESTGTDKEWFDALCAKYGDVSYDSKQSVGLKGQYAFVPQCITPDLLSIDVKANVDLGPEYPAGASLAACMGIRFRSDYDYVTSGYKDIASIQKDKDLNLVTSNDLMMMEYTEYLFELYFKPTAQLPAGPWILTVNCTDADGRRLSASLTINE